MTDIIITPRPTVICYRDVTIRPASAGFGEFDARDGSSDDIWDDVSDIINECDCNGAVTTETTGWEGSEDQELVEAIQAMRGRIHGEPDILVAIRKQIGAGDEQISVFGADRVECYGLGADGNHGYVTVEDYNNAPERYTLA